MSRKVKNLLALVAVLALVAIAGRLLEPPSPKLRDDTRDEVVTVAAAVQRYYRDYNQWPQSLQDLTHNPKQTQYVNWPAGMEGKDAWGHPLRYLPYSDKLGYGLVESYGENGRPEPEGAVKSDDIIVRFNPSKLMGP